MLLKRLLESTKYEDKKVIGLIGVSRGAGVTYTGMLLSYYFAIEKRIKTAFLECNNHMDFERLQYVYEWNKEEEKSFSLDRITYYKQVSRVELGEILSDDYGCYIMDFGTDFISWKEELVRCGTKIIIGDQAIWNQSKIIEFLNSLENIRGYKNWINMIPCADKRVLIGLAKKTNRNFYGIPYEPDPIMLSKESHRLFRNLFG